MGARTVARECALMVLFGLEMTEDDPADAVRAFFTELADEAGLLSDEEARAYALEVVRGVRAEQAELDELIRTASEHWRLERMTRVDRNLLRLGAWELRHGVPRPVAIDEAVELAKRFGTSESSAFVNGILDRIADEVARP
jgi:N utilization substance protein B